MEPVYLDYLVIGHQYHAEALKRALIDRIQDKIPSHPLTILPCLRRDERFQKPQGNPIKPLASAFCWIEGEGSHFINNGLKQGGTYKNIPKSTSPISPASLFQLYRTQANIPDDDLCLAKRSSIAYQDKKTMLLDQILKGWIRSSQCSQ